MAIPLNWNAETVTRVLRRASYRTGAAGKLHLQPYGAAEDVTRALVGTRTAAVASAGSPQWDHWENRTIHESQPIELVEDYYGFDHVDLVIGGSDNGRGTLSPLAPQPRGGPGTLARTRQRAGGPGRLGSGLQDGSTREALPHELHRRPHEAVPRRRRRHWGTLFLLVVVSGPAPSVHPARPVLRHVRPGPMSSCRRPSTTHSPWPHPTSGR